MPLLLMLQHVGLGHWQGIGVLTCTLAWIPCLSPAAGSQGAADQKLQGLALALLRKYLQRL